MVHKIWGWITSLPTVRSSESDQNSLSYRKNSLGAFLPQARLFTIAEWFWEKWMVHLKRIQKWWGSAKTRHGSDKNWLQGTSAKWSRLSFWKNIKNTKKRKRGVLIRSLPKWNTLVKGCIRLYHFNSESTVQFLRVKREKLVFPLPRTLGKFHLLACSSINTCLYCSSSRVQSSAKDSASFDVIVIILS